MDRAGQHGHLAGGLSRPDDADELGWAVLVGIAAKHAETTAAQQIEGVGDVTLGEQRLAAGQGEPAGAGVPAALKDAGEGVFQPVGADSGHGRNRRGSRWR